tara:strand:- start:16580 stop:16810 length:231 start_codon:yes stop_codon:yes gene_type:complete
MPICRECGDFVKWEKTNGKYHLADHNCKPKPKKVDPDFEKRLALVKGVCFNGHNLEEGLLEYVLDKGRTDKFIFDK